MIYPKSLLIIMIYIKSLLKFDYNVVCTNCLCMICRFAFHHFQLIMQLKISVVSYMTWMVIYQCTESLTDNISKGSCPWLAIMTLDSECYSCFIFWQNNEFQTLIHCNQIKIYLNFNMNFWNLNVGGGGMLKMEDEFVS